MIKERNQIGNTTEDNSTRIKKENPVEDDQGEHNQGDDDGLEEVEDIRVEDNLVEEDILAGDNLVEGVEEHNQAEGSLEEVEEHSRAEDTLAEDIQAALTINQGIRNRPPALRIVT